MTTGFQHTEELCQTLFEATSDSIFVSDAQGYFLEVNPQGCALLSYSMEELRQRSWPDLLSTEDRAQELLAWEEGNEDQPVWIEDQVRDKEGRLLTVEIRLRRLAQGHRVAFVRDITEPKRVEETLRRSEQKFETAFRISPDAVNLNRLNDGLYIDINEGFTRITGYTREEVLGQPSLALNIWADPADRARLVQGLRERGQVENLEADFRMKDGTLRTGLMSARLIEVEDEVCLLSITRDITERKQAEAALRLSEARLGGIIDSAMDAILALDETQSIILFNAAAEKMFGYSAAEILGQPLDRLMPERLREIHREYLPVFYRRDEDTSLMGWQRDIVGRRANGEEFPVEASISHIEVNGAKHYTAILRDITERKQAEAALRESEERFRLFMDNSPTTAWMQDEQSRYVYLNRTYEKRFGVRLEEWRGKSIFEVWPAEVATQYRQNDLQMLAAGHLLNFTQRIPNFEPFFTTKEQGKGTGLGLATVYGIIKQSGGEITVTSQPGQGTIFSLYLPALETVSTGLAAPPSEPAIQPGRETILMVEDEQGVRDLVWVALRDYGYTLLEANHGYQALALAQQEKSIDLLLTDVVMPQMDGRELAERLKVLHPRIKVLFISGYTDNEVIRRGLQTAEVEFLPKPFSPAALATKVREILDK